MAATDRPLRGFSRSYLDLSMAHWRIAAVPLGTGPSATSESASPGPSDETGVARRAEDGPV
ncbi:MAG TPA: hypothetical protein VE646_03570, partial [Actinomycetota bacterium]|nr:hypothetical protein [Actinomycetota bacterium]